MLLRVDNALRRTATYVRSRIPSVLAVVVVFCIPLCLLAWYFDVTDDLSGRVTLTVIAVLVLL